MSSENQANAADKAYEESLGGGTRTESVSDASTGTDTSAAGSDSRDADARAGDARADEASTIAAGPSVDVADSRQTTEGTVYTVTGGDWDEVLADAAGDERIVMNLGPQHPSTHGVLRLVLELEGESVTQARSVIGYLHTGIEKNLEYRNWTQGVTFVTRMDYLAPLHNEAAYCMSVEKLLGVEVPQRAQVIRVLLMELNRISSHLVALATGGMELGALTGMTAGFREREEVLHLLEHLTGLRMNHAFIRPGGVAQDLPADAVEKIRSFLKIMDKRLPDYDKLLTGQPIWRNRLAGVGYLPVDACLALGITGPILRSAGLPWDLRKVEPYSGYETYDFDVPTSNAADSFARYLMRVEEIHQSLRLVRQAVDRLEPGPVMVEDAKIAWPAQLTIGSDGMGNSLEHVRKIMGQSMESLIHHFKLVTEGFDVPAGQVYVPIESPRGELGYHVVSDGGTRPFRVHVREPSFVNLQSMPAMCEGGMVADVIASVASIDPVMGGCDR
ncbi:NADH-quinone oxidoreductase subunit D [Umezawaea endophytica]|uniref:NADH-quinone oxidoreductase subunit D n=1 Tax=Umezawaea endophytica TaxID=1654476 RepID=A0A9X2VWT6_9PSEU|nr:NADH-quinone oxidoreductase subunit D [Umezawaea endophytica]MCS7484375.1 NADH-quinone oxidoreductase subunit D [Umezawaea endophytica]